MRRVLRCLVPLFLVLIFNHEAQAQADQVVYDDTLNPVWQNWSWCATDLNSVDFIHAGAKSVKVTYTAGWQGFYLHHGAFDSTGFSTLTFWINGGTLNGRNITVAGLLSDVAQTAVPLNSYIAGGSVAANTWRKVTIPLSALQINNHIDVTGFWLQDASGGSQTAFYVDDVVLVAVPPPSQVTVNVDAGIVKRTVDARMFGVATAVWDAAFNTTGTINLLSANGTKVSRFPGGSLSDSYHWATNTTDNNTWQWATNFDAFANVVRTIGAQAFITVNYGTSTPQDAANWVKNSNITKGYGFKYWEIGNENYGSWENDTRPRPHDPYSYAVAARDYINAMKAIDPTIKVGVVGITGEDSYANYTDHPATNPRTGQAHNGWMPVMLATLRSLGVTPDFVVHHKYDQAPGAESDSFLLQSASTWTNNAADLRQQLNDYLGAQAANVELVVTENNSVYSNPGKQTTSLVNGLFYADSFGQILQTEFNTLMWWIFRNAQESGNNNSPSLYGWRLYGDYGMVSDQNDRYPTYFMTKLMSRFTAGGDQVIRATSDYNLIAPYAVKRAGGGVALLLINKSPTTTLTASINLAGFTPLSSATVDSYGIPQDEAARTGTGSPEIATSSFSGAGTSFTYACPPYSATVLSLASAAVCSPSLSPTSQFFPVSGGPGSVSIAVGGGCGWSAASNTGWITLTSSGSGTGNTTVTFHVAANFTASARIGTLTIAGQTVTVVQDGGVGADCTYSGSLQNKVFSSTGGTSTLTVMVQERCAWQATSDKSWITITSGSVGVGAGTVNFAVAPNTGATSRKGQIKVGSLTFVVKQKAP